MSLASLRSGDSVSARNPDVRQVDHYRMSDSQRPPDNDPTDINDPHSQRGIHRTSTQERLPCGALWVQHVFSRGGHSPRSHTLHVLELPASSAGEAWELWHLGGPCWRWKTGRGTALGVFVAAAC